ncbi:hypothetical protein KNV07_gp067 [Vibrio phage Cody]|uniref:Uncharacterized protein n=1 Tax=Vibrio phage Cody TaxID=2736263 RepID=A0A6M9Z240_9CAUD|nr:hypothetical protein KNV07_gp067 [Vibrio phage Cody]QKN85117.1 hypothetical protein CODY_67 [Vibrio phage Cody]QQO89703.1 hypothetical protein GRLPWR_68 [Vibrio phage GRLPWR]QQO89901.1 hypothetical protein ABURR_66 [Vibrio phage ABurr]WBU76681.1 hypothetical protein JAVIER_62 [Vibrio phage Javier]
MRLIKCAGCNKIAMEIEDGRLAKGTIVRCAKCEEKLQKQLQNLSFLAKMNENKESNPLADLFAKFK